MASDKSLNVTVPKEDLDRFDKEAEKMGFNSRAAYLRAMINAGRREFGLDPQGDGAEDGTLQDFIDERILDAVNAADGARSGEVIEEVTGEIEDLVRESIEQLNETGTIEYSVNDDGLIVAKRDN
ncbi:DUF5805 domain-containing protein [Halobaculum roseum]|uniref:DUF5805 domain-containing protein n=1 Tax=Halobaculum roseum TaxID=2175149 RepID=A0ABD5MJU6_9EURY|nr:DUF5805 domain-containing protein [Halobaculum roseum]QZY04057.1 DUF5805 domain-containing protein [Halobaculum roseum]